MQNSEIDFSSVQFSADSKADGSIKKFITLLLAYNEKVNLVSRKINPLSLFQLFHETLDLYPFISDEASQIVDAGSGNGILGLPVAALASGKKIVLVESIKKKALFLEFAAKELNLENVTVFNGRLEDLFPVRGGRNKTRAKNKPFVTIISRGFPSLDLIASLITEGAARQATVITSQNKIEKITIPMDSLTKKIYNLPLRDSIRILILEKI